MLLADPNDLRDWKRQTLKQVSWYLHRREPRKAAVVETAARPHPRTERRRPCPTASSWR